MGERTPHLDPDCRGAFIGLSAMHTKYDMLRAVMEGVTYSQRDSVEVLKTMGVSIDGMLALRRRRFLKAVASDACRYV